MNKNFAAWGDEGLPALKSIRITLMILRHLIKSIHFIKCIMIGQVKIWSRSAVAYNVSQVYLVADFENENIMNIEFMCGLLANYSKELSEAGTYREKGDVQLKHAKLILDKVKNCSIPAVVGQREQLSCPHCGQLEPCAGNSPETCYHPKVC